jgi:hypothetical protein
MYVGPNGRVAAIPAGADSAQYRIVRQPAYAWEGLRWTDSASWLIVAAFFWPFPLVAYRVLHRTAAARWPTWCAEGAAAAGSAYLILALSELGHRAVGAYVGLGANAIYGITVLYELLRRSAATRSMADRVARGE